MNCAAVCAQPESQADFIRRYFVQILPFPLCFDAQIALGMEPRGGPESWSGDETQRQPFLQSQTSATV